MGNEDVRGQIGGSKMIGVAAGGKAEFGASFTDGKVSFSAELCGQLGVGACLAVELEVDRGAMEDFSADYLRTRYLGGEFTEPLAEATKDIAKTIDEDMKLVEEELESDKAG